MKFKWNIYLLQIQDLEELVYKYINVYKNEIQIMHYKTTLVLYLRIRSQFNKLTLECINHFLSLSLPLIKLPDALEERSPLFGIGVKSPLESIDGRFLLIHNALKGPPLLGILSIGILRCL